METDYPISFELSSQDMSLFQKACSLTRNPASLWNRNLTYLQVEIGESLNTFTTFWHLVKNWFMWLLVFVAGVFVHQTAPEAKYCIHTRKRIGRKINTQRKEKIRWEAEAGTMKPPGFQPWKDITSTELSRCQNLLSLRMIQAMLPTAHNLRAGRYQALLLTSQIMSPFERFAYCRVF